MNTPCPPRRAFVASDARHRGQGCTAAKKAKKPAAAVTHLADGHVDNARPLRRDGGHLRYDYAVIQDTDGRATKV